MLEIALIILVHRVPDYHRFECPPGQLIMHNRIQCSDVQVLLKSPSLINLAYFLTLGRLYGNSQLAQVISTEKIRQKQYQHS